MLKKSLLTISLVVISVCAVAFGGRISGRAGKANVTQDVTVAREQGLPEHVPYIFLFEHLRHLKKKSDEFKNQGKDGSGFQRRFKKTLVIDDDQFARLEEIALSLEPELEAVDKKAEKVIKEFKKTYPEGVVPPGTVIPPPPAELTALQEERNRLILRGRDRLKGALGEMEFNRFDQIMKSRLAPNIKRNDHDNQAH